MSVDSLDVATRLLGQGETGANNAGRFVERLFRGARRRGNWCAVFVAYCLEESNTVPLMTDKERRGAKGLTRRLGKRYKWVFEPRRLSSPVAIGSPKPGDVVAWHRGPGSSWRDWARNWRGHVEIITCYDRTTDTVSTIAGNSGRFPAVVKRRTHKAGRWRRKLYGIARPGVTK